MDVYSALMEFGLENRETKVYTALLELGPTTASQLAKKVSILRPTMYEVLNRMMQKGVISSSISGGKKIFEAIKPKILLQILDDKKKILQDFIPELEELVKVGHTEQKVSTFFGEKGLKTIYDDMLVEGKTIYHILNYVEHSKVFKLYWTQNFIKKRLEKGIQFKAIVSKIIDKELEKTDKARLREIRKLKKVEEFKASLFIYGNKCGFFTTKDSLIGVLIESPTITASLKIMFNILWKIAKD